MSTLWQEAFRSRIRARRLRFFLFALFPVLFFLAGCDSIGLPGLGCSAEAEPALVVEVRNSATGDPEAGNAMGVLIDGSYTDSLRAKEMTEEGLLSLAGGAERTGTYTIRIEKQGFETWTREGVDVDEGTCGPKTERLNAHLKPAD
jgi:hypothetical protein